MPTQAELDHFLSQNPWSPCESLRQKVTGNFTGTTDEIMQWAAHKWGLPEDVLRAVATVESWWHQSAGDATGGGITSVTPNTLGAEHLDPNTGIYRKSTAFALDFFAAKMRYYFDGCATWLNDVERGQSYAPGDLWGSIGAWYSGRWHTAAAEWYIDRVQGDLGRRVWEQAGF